jgi:rsbT antagonist protein RsbS
MNTDATQFLVSRDHVKQEVLPGFSIIKQGANLIALIQPVPELTGIIDELLRQVGLHHSRGVILDLSALDVIDSYSTRMLAQTAQTLRLQGVETVIAGIQTDVAFAMVQMGLTFDRINLALDVDDGLALLTKRTEVMDQSTP